MFWYAGSCDEMPGAVRCCVSVPFFGMGRKVGGSNGRPNHVSSPFCCSPPILAAGLDAVYAAFVYGFPLKARVPGP